MSFIREQPSMSANLISASTRVDFREALASHTLREIRDIFAAGEFEPNLEFQPPVSAPTSSESAKAQFDSVQPTHSNFDDVIRFYARCNGNRKGQCAASIFSINLEAGSSRNLRIKKCRQLVDIVLILKA